MLGSMVAFVSASQLSKVKWQCLVPCCAVCVHLVDIFW